MVVLPLKNGFRRDTFRAQMDARHVVRAVDEEKQHEGEQVHSDENRDRVQQTPEDVANHRAASEGWIRASRYVMRGASVRSSQTNTPYCLRPAALAGRIPRGTPVMHRDVQMPRQDRECPKRPLRT